MSHTEQRAYDKHIEGLMISESELKTARYEGRLEGKIEGKIEGVVESYKAGLDIALISRIFKMTEAEVSKLLKEKGLK